MVQKNSFQVQSVSAEATQNARASSNWTVEEKELLARAEATLVFEGNHRPAIINMQLSGMVGARSLQAIKGRRRCPDHRERMAQHLEVMGQGGEARPVPRRPCLAARASPER